MNRIVNNIKLTQNLTCVNNIKIMQSNNQFFKIYIDILLFLAEAKCVAKLCPIKNQNITLLIINLLTQDKVNLA